MKSPPGPPSPKYSTDPAPCPPTPAPCRRNRPAGTPSGAFHCRGHRHPQRRSRRHPQRRATANLHHDHFGAAFGITRDGAPASSACLAFGLERWLFALTDRHGPDPAAWPDVTAAAAAAATTDADAAATTAATTAAATARAAAP